MAGFATLMPPPNRYRLDLSENMDPEFKVGGLGCPLLTLEIALHIEVSVFANGLDRSIESMLLGMSTVILLEFDIEVY